jgi:hypothetical protein
LAALADIRAGLKTAFETVTGIGPVLKYPPKSIPANYTLYLTRTGFETVRAGQVRGVRWEFTARLVILWQDAEQGEVDLDLLTKGIIAAIDADAHLGGKINSGLAEITSGEDGWFQLENSASWYRFTDFTVSVLDKG